MSVLVTPVRSGADRKEFVDLPFRLHRRDACWVPPLRGDAAALMDPRRHPFHEHATVEFFLARRGGSVAGRIAAIENRAHIEFHGEKTGFFGLFESENDTAVANALLDAASAWLSARELTAVRGPASFSSNEEWALLVEGFDSPATVMMPYNPPYYVDLLEGAGFHGAKDLVAYILSGDRVPASLLERAATAEPAGDGVFVRTIDMRRFRAEVEIVKAIYNRAWERNWGFVPMTGAEIDHMAKQLRPVVDRNLVLFLETPTGTAGFALALPDVNTALIHVRDGRLWPFGLPKLLWYGRRIRRVRVLALGLLPEYRKRGLDNILYLELFRRALERGYTSGEFSWILEDNVAMRRPLEKIGATVYKRYRVYERSLAPAAG